MKPKSETRLEFILILVEILLVLATVITAVMAHASKSMPGECSSRAMLAETMKIPEPIMLPTMMVVASKSFNP
jgi:hypothetical protein